MRRRKINLALVCTIGGHFEQLTNLARFYDSYDHFWITNKNRQTVSHLKNQRKYFISMAHFKKPWTYLYQIPSIIRIFIQERPTHVLSTGSGRTALIPFVLSKCLNIKFFYIDTFSRVNGYSKFGSFLLRLGHNIFTQWSDDNNHNAVYIGPIFEELRKKHKNTESDFIFVTVGTRDEPFTRLIEAVEVLVKKNTIKEKVIIQAGHTQYTSDYLAIFDFCTPERIDKLITNAKYVITQESAGIGTKCLKHKTRFFVMPRDYEHGELPAKSDMNEDLHFKLQEMGYTKVVHNVTELEEAINNISSIKSGFSFDNTLAIDALTRLMEAT